MLNGASARAWLVTFAFAAIVGVGAAIDAPAQTLTAQSKPAYLNTSLSPAERAADLISRMTLTEKATQLASTNAPAIPRLGVQEYAYWSEALHGVNAFWGGDQTAPAGVDINNVKATSFPSNLSVSLAWNPKLLHRETSVISTEARGFLDPSLFGDSQNNLGPEPGAYGSLFYFSPTLNLLRDPRWGRSDEGFGEDPFLTGVLGSAWVNGFLGQTLAGRPRGRYLKAVSTIKHYALNNVENNRMGLSSDTDEATIRDYYTRQFRDVIRRAHATGVMSSYNAINGTPAVSNNLTMNVLLRRTFGFRGYTTSDCGAVGTQYRRNNPAASNPPPGQAAALVLSGHDWAPPGWTTNHGDQAAIWIKNGSLTALSARAGAQAWALRAGTTLNCVGWNGLIGHPAFWDPIRPVFSDENRPSFIEAAIAAGALSEGVIDRQLLGVFTMRMRTGEFDPRRGQPYTKIKKNVIQQPAHRRLTQTVAEQTLTLLQNRAPAGSRRRLLPADPKTTRKVVVLGDQANQAFLGQYSGRPDERITLLAGIRQVVPRAEVVYDDAGTATDAVSPPEIRPGTREAIKAADLVVVMVGTDEHVMTEGYDRRSIKLPGNYEQLIDQVAAVGNPRIVLVDQSAGPVDLTRARRKVAAILFSAANGQRQGIAAARVIFGKVNPSGHLSFTWYAGDHQLPEMNDYDLTPAETGGLGRTYQYFARKPTWPFGHGGSYTRFRYSKVRVSSRRVNANGALRVSLRVFNRGKRPGADVVQIYAAPPRSAGATAPRQRLVGFRRTRVLKPGRSQRITIRIPLTPTLRTWNAARNRSVIYRGRWRFRLARSSADIERTLRVRVAGRIARRIGTVSIAPPKLVLTSGETLDLRGRNPWLDGLAPQRYERIADPIITAVRRDDSFARLRSQRVRFSSSNPRVLRVESDGVIKAVRPGVATVTVTVGRATASTPFVVK